MMGPENENPGALAGATGADRKAIELAEIIAESNVAVYTEAEAETPVIAAFNRWNALRAQWHEASDAHMLSDEESNEWCTIVFDASHEVLTIPSTGARDVLAKIIAFTDFGNYTIGEGDDPRTDVIWAEARALLGGAA